jgi:excisionase family DNA binding protein
MALRDKYLNTKEAAEYIGYSVSGLRKLMAIGLIPFTKPRGRLYFKKLDLEKFIQNEL